MDSAHEMSFHHYLSVPARGHGCQKERVKRVSEVQSWFHFEDRKKNNKSSSATLIVQGKIKRKSLSAQLLTRREASGLVTNSDIGDNFPNLALEHAAGGDCGNLEVSGPILSC